LQRLYFQRVSVDKQLAERSALQGSERLAQSSRISAISVLESATAEQQASTPGGIDMARNVVLGRLARARQACHRYCEITMEEDAVMFNAVEGTNGTLKDEG
jgi:hypothetical protein